MKPFTINGLYIKPFDKLKMSALERGFVKRWLNLVQLLVCSLLLPISSMVSACNCLSLDKLHLK